MKHATAVKIMVMWFAQQLTALFAPEKYFRLKASVAGNVLMVTYRSYRSHQEQDVLRMGPSIGLVGDVGIGNHIIPYAVVALYMYLNNFIEVYWCRLKQ